MPSRTLWLWLFVGSLAVTAVLGMMAFLIDHFPFQEELLASSGLLSAYSLAGLVGTIALARAPRRWIVVTACGGLGLLALSFLVWMSFVWFNARLDYQTEETLVRLGGTLTILGVLGLHTSLLMLAALRGRVGLAVRWLSIAAACALACMLLVIIWEADWISSDWKARLSGTLALPAALGTIAIPVLARIEFVSRRDGEEHTIGRFVPVRFLCPRCQHESEQAANRRFLCPGCGLEANITVAEPRCTCGYLLHGLPEPVCPECGRAVEKGMWWRAEAAPPRGGEPSVPAEGGVHPPRA